MSNLGVSVRLPVIDTGAFHFSRTRRANKVIPPFASWLKQISPTWKWTWKYQAYIQSHVERVTNGECKRLMLFVPPRHGKSEMVTVRYPVYRLVCDPSRRIIIGAYNQTLAEKFSRKARKIARSLFDLSEERTAAEDWETPAGGGVRAVGVGGGITGQGGDLIIIDDPVKSRDEANSKAYRERVWDWYTDDLYTRLEPCGAIILIMTRWHEDDLAGRILASEDGPNWETIILPALAEENDPLGRNFGDALCPERYPVSELQKIRTAIGTRSFSALYQQRPMEQEGDFFKRSWFEIVRETPADGVRVRYWDKAATFEDGAYTVGLLMNKSGKAYYIEDVVRGQWSTRERDDVMRQTTEADQQKYGYVTTWFEQEPGSSGVDVSRSIITMLDGYPVHADKVTGSKEIRAEPFQSQAEAGNVKLKAGRWNADFIDELASFPNGTYKDQVDAASGAHNKLSDQGNAMISGSNPLENYRG